MELAARIGTMANSSSRIESIVENFRKMLATERETGVLDLTGLYDEHHIYTSNSGRNGQIFSYYNFSEIIIPNIEVRATGAFSSDTLRILRLYDVNSASVLRNCPNLTDVYLQGATSEALVSRTSWFPYGAPNTCAFHCNDGKKVVYDESTSAWIVVDDISTEGGGY